MKPTEKSPVWITVYADMMTNLMLFFLAAFVITRADRSIQTRASDSFRTEITGKKKQSPDKKYTDKELRDKFTNKYSKVEINENKIKITLTEQVLFESGSADLSVEMKKKLSEIADIIRKTNNPIIVEGYTDNIPMKKGSNWELSLARATNVSDYLTNVENISHSRFMVAGYGEYKPLVPNINAENRRQNRRIEITIVRYE